MYFYKMFFFVSELTHEYPWVFLPLSCVEMYIRPRKQYALGARTVVSPMTYINYNLDNP